jgi:hypothetical protein
MGGRLSEFICMAVLYGLQQQPCEKSTRRFSVTQGNSRPVGWLVSSDSSMVHPLPSQSPAIDISRRLLPKLVLQVKGRPLRRVSVVARGRRLRSHPSIALVIGPGLD